MHHVRFGTKATGSGCFIQVKAHTTTIPAMHEIKMSARPQEAMTVRPTTARHALGVPRSATNCCRSAVSVHVESHPGPDSLSRCSRPQAPRVTTAGARRIAQLPCGGGWPYRAAPSAQCPMRCRNRRQAGRYPAVPTWAIMRGSATHPVVTKMPRCRLL